MCVFAVDFREGVDRISAVHVLNSLRLKAGFDRQLIAQMKILAQ